MVTTVGNLNNNRNQPDERIIANKVACNFIDTIITNAKLNYFSTQNSATAFSFLEREIKDNFEPVVDSKSETPRGNSTQIFIIQRYQPKSDKLTEMQSSSIYVRISSQKDKKGPYFLETMKSIELGVNDAQGCLHNAIVWQREKNNYKLLV